MITSITIEPCSDDKLYMVRIVSHCPDYGYEETVHAVTPEGLGAFLLEYLPYTPEKKLTITENDNVRPFTRS